MAKNIGSTINVSDESTTTVVEVGNSTAVTLAAANPKRISLHVIHSENQTLIVREYPAAQDDEKFGFKVNTLVPYKTIPGNVYTGEISGIMFSGGGLKDITVIEL